MGTWVMITGNRSKMQFATERPPFNIKDLTDWTRNYDFVLHFYPSENTPLFPRLLRQIVRGSFFSLYEVVQTRDPSSNRRALSAHKSHNPPAKITISGRTPPSTGPSSV